MAGTGEELRLRRLLVVAPCVFVACRVGLYQEALSVRAVPPHSSAQQPIVRYT